MPTSILCDRAAGSNQSAEVSSLRAGGRDLEPATRSECFWPWPGWDGMMICHVIPDAVFSMCTFYRTPAVRTLAS
jgi:hypothetical protein